MPIRYAQRQHIVGSLERILYQLYAASFFLSPALLPYLCRTFFQFQFASPRDLEPRLSLRFWFILILLFNVSSIWAHATEGPAQGRSVVLDFVGPGSPPTKLHLLCIDFAIIVINMVLTTIAYETSLQSAMPSDTPDPLLPIPPRSPTAAHTIFAADEDEEDRHKADAAPESPYILDLRIGHIYRRLRNPAPPPPERELSSDDLLPLPNTTPWHLTNTLQILMRARARARQRARAEADARREQAGEDGDRRTIPGALDST
ncbi:hypothetical protein PsYK624_116380 [Phanerochaete sordida]|uniref:DUF1746 domain-containing protein n=1 Tax=Phanerochaete sordida TaxID=48140 RepID=A0A9P3LI99_9APHY|nr:hypothetical protein PsYK624_116380 [Phanerochaete sordida]